MRPKISLGRVILGILFAVILAKLIDLGINIIKLPGGIFFAGWFSCAFMIMFIYWKVFFPDEDVIQPTKETEPKYEIEKTLVISTGHIPHFEFETMQSDDEFPYRVIKHEYGLIVVLHGIDDISEFVEADSYMRGHFSNAWNVIKFAQELGCRYINFDQDGELYPNLPQFNW